MQQSRKSICPFYDFFCEVYSIGCCVALSSWYLLNWVMFKSLKAQIMPDMSEVCIAALG